MTPPPPDPVKPTNVWFAAAAVGLAKTVRPAAVLLSAAIGAGYVADPASEVHWLADGSGPVVLLIIAAVVSLVLTMVERKAEFDLEREAARLDAKQAV